MAEKNDKISSGGEEADLEKEEDLEKREGLEHPDKAEREKKEERRKNTEFFKGTLFGILLCGVFALGIFFVSHGTVNIGNSREGAEALTDLEVQRKLQQIRDQVKSDYLYEADGDFLVSMMFKGLAVGLKDPYASYYTPEEVEEITQINEGEYYGIGITMLKDPETGQIRIAGVYEESPAWEAGLKVDDVFLTVAGESVEGMDLSSLAALVKQQKEKVEIQILRGEETKTFTVSLKQVEIPTVKWELLEDQTGYVKIAEFDKVTVEQFRKAIKELEEQGMEKLVVDVRDNPGGVLDAVCQILDDLLPEGPIVFTEEKNGDREEYTSDKDQIYDGPLAVLVNGNSASASELFAGAIQDYELGPVIGTQTFGKGVVQRTYLFQDGSALKFTTEKYYTAGEQDIDGTGITPDLIVEQQETGEKLEGQAEDSTLQRALNYFKEMQETSAKDTVTENHTSEKSE